MTFRYSRRIVSRIWGGGGYTHTKIKRGRRGPGKGGGVKVSYSSLLGGFRFFLSFSRGLLFPVVLLF